MKKMLNKKVERKKDFFTYYITSVKSTLINYETLVEVAIFTPKKLI